MGRAKMNNIFVNSRDYDSRFNSLVAALESCAWSTIANCDSCPVSLECRQLFDSLADRVTHYRISEKDYQAFMNHFKGLKKQMVLC